MLVKQRKHMFSFMLKFLCTVLLAALAPILSCIKEYKSCLRNRKVDFHALRKISATIALSIFDDIVSP